MNEEILRAVKKLHIKVWEEMQAPCGYHLVKAENERQSAERNLRKKLAKYNPRDTYVEEINVP